MVKHKHVTPEMRQRKRKPAGFCCVHAFLPCGKLVSVPYIFTLGKSAMLENALGGVVHIMTEVQSTANRELKTFPAIPCLGLEADYLVSGAGAGDD